MSLTNKIMFHVRAFKADIITELDLEQAINEELHGPVSPPAIDRDWYTIKEDGTPDYYNRFEKAITKFLRESKGELEY